MKNLIFLIVFFVSITTSANCAVLPNLNADVNLENTSFVSLANYNLNIVLIPLTDAKLGLEANYQIVYSNKGLETVSGKVFLDFDSSKMSFLSTNSESFQLESNKIYFDYNQLKAQESRSINISFSIFQSPIVKNNDLLDFTTSITPMDRDVDFQDNIYNLQQRASNMADPNNKRALEGEQISIDNAENFIHFIIHFQNKGTEEAMNIRVNDVLEDKLDVSTFEIVSFSHTATIEIAGKSIDFIFNNINLPIEENDPEGSKGFVVFKVRPIEGIVVGDIIRNRASIYFDTDPPILTNIVEIEFIENLSISDFNALQVQVYPNPVNTILHVDALSTISSIQIISVIGQEVLFVNPTSNTEIINLSELPSGSYFAKVTIKNASKVYKIIKR